MRELGAVIAMFVLRLCCAGSAWTAGGSSSPRRGWCAATRSSCPRTTARRRRECRVGCRSRVRREVPAASH